MLTPSSYDDKELLRLISQGDKPAFDEIYLRYWLLLFNSAYKRLKNTDQCKDVVQDVFVDLWTRRGKVAIQNLNAYLHTAVKFQVYKLAAKNHAITTFYNVYETMATRPLNAAGNVEEKEIAELFRLWLDTLPDKRRQIFIMHYADGFSTKEIADRLGISQKTVQNQLGLASDSLNKEIIPAIIILLNIKELLQ